MNNIKNNIKDQFTICPNALLSDDRLSRDAKYLFIWMASKPDDWVFHQDATAKAISCEARALRKYINELVDSGWISRERMRTDEAKFLQWHYTLNPEPVYQKGTVPERHSAKNVPLIKKDPEQINNCIEREREQFTEVMRYYRTKVNNRWEVSTNGKYRKRLSDLIHQGRAISDIKKVIDHRFAELENGLPQYLVEPDNIFKHDLFLKTLNAANFKPAQKPKAVNGKNSGIQLAGEEGFKDKPSGWENYGI